MGLQDIEELNIQFHLSCVIAIVDNYHLVCAGRRRFLEVVDLIFSDKEDSFCLFVLPVGVGG